MKLPALTVSLFCLFIAPLLAKAQNLKGLHDVDIVVEGIEDSSKAAGLTDDFLKDQVRAAFKRDVPKLTISKSWQSLQATFYVRVALVPITYGNSESAVGYAFSVEASLNRPVQILGKAPTLSIASVWNRISLTTSPRDSVPSHVRDDICDLVTIFATDYYKDNP